MIFAGLVVVEAVVGVGVKLGRGRNRGQQDMLTVAEMLEGKVRENNRIGAWSAGIYGYYSGLTVINLDGLINDEISGYVKKNKVNWPYWLDRKIEYLVDYEPFFRGVAMRYHGEQLIKLFAYEPEYGSKPIVCYEITRRSDSVGEE